MRNLKFKKIFKVILLIFFLKLNNLFSQEIQEIKNLKIKDSSIDDISFHPNGKYIASTVCRVWGGTEFRCYSYVWCKEGEIVIWDIENKSIAKRIKVDENIWSIQFSKTGRYILASGYEYIKVWEIDSELNLKGIHNFKISDTHVFSTLFTPDEKYIVSGDMKGRARVFNIENGEKLLDFEPHKEMYPKWRYPILTSIAVSSDSKYFATCGCAKVEGELCTQGEINVFEIETGNKIRSFVGHEYEVYTIAFSPDGKYLISGSCAEARGKFVQCIKGEIKVWELETGRCVKTITAHRGAVIDIAYSNDGKFFACSGCNERDGRGWCIKGGISIWDANSFDWLCDIESFETSPNSIAFSSDSKYLAASECGERSEISYICYKGEIKIWDLSDLIKELEKEE